eukprot:3936954-Rhodomonas_salina.1
MTRKLLSGFSAATADVDVLAVFSKGTTPGINTDILKSMPGVTGVAPIEVPATVAMSPDFVPDVSAGKPSGSSNSGAHDDADGSNTALIAGVCAGVGGLVLLLAGVVLYKKNESQATDVPVIHAINADDLKAQLQNDL